MIVIHSTSTELMGDVLTSSVLYPCVWTRYGISVVPKMTDLLPSDFHSVLRLPAVCMCSAVRIAIHLSHEW